MRRAALLAVVVSVLLGAFAGVAWATDVFCTGGRCDGTEQSDFITGTPQRDVIFALGGFDEVYGLAGQDELNGNNGGDGLFGGNNSDTYNGGNGNDFLSEFEDVEGNVTNSGADVMNGGTSADFMEGNTGADILRGQDGDEEAIFGDSGNDKLYGGKGEDFLDGDDGTDEHYGGADNDFIDATHNEDPMTDAPDLVDCGSGFDTAEVRPNDIVRDNCENVTPVTTVAAAPGTTVEDHQQQRGAFLAERGGG
jgi:Ca2+-binding RTX toxin-like protein